MLFLLNDVVLDLDDTCPVSSHELSQFASLDLDSVIDLGCQLYAEEPQLHRRDPVRARRLAWLIAQQCESVNAALFIAPEAGCDPLLVEPRFCALPLTVLTQLHTGNRRSQRAGNETSLADQMVWPLNAA